jgi:glycosyltransferase involved in cell wall biosynthesis
MRILHVITGLDIGGAETMLLKLLSAGSGDCDIAVVSLSDEGTIGPRISSLGIPVFSLRLKGAVFNPIRVLSIRSITRKFRPSIIVGWMPHGNLMASLAAGSWSNGTPVLWNVRRSLYSLDAEPRLTAVVIKLGALLSRHPAAIVYNSLTGAKQHEAFGYRAAKRIVIPNGFDCRLFKPDGAARLNVRAELGIPRDALLVGLIARYHLVKDHAGFLKAAGLVAQQQQNVYFVLAGRGVTSERAALAKCISAEHLQQRVFLLGERSDIPRLTAALDIACSASNSEGFSNAIGEGMACGVPCVVTDVGDGGFIIGDTGLLVPPGNPQALAEALTRLTAAGADHRRQLGAAARQRVEKKFSLEAIVRCYEELYAKIALRPGS